MDERFKQIEKIPNPALRDRARRVAGYLQMALLGDIHVSPSFFGVELLASSDDARIQVSIREDLSVVGTCTFDRDLAPWVVEVGPEDEPGSDVLGNGKRTKNRKGSRPRTPALPPGKKSG